MNLRIPLTFLLILSSCCFSTAFAATTAPNLMIVLTDDQGWGDLGVNGHPLIRTPNIDTLAREGQRWTNFYVAESVCSPSRGALLTGRLPVRTGIYGRSLTVLLQNDPQFKIPTTETTLPQVLSNAGYETALVGKWHLGDKPDAAPTRYGFKSWWGFPYSNDIPPAFLDSEALMKQAFTGDMKSAMQGLGAMMEAYAHPKAEDWNLELRSSRATATGFDDRQLETHVDQQSLTERITDESIKFLKQPRKHPFFLMVTYTAPHTPLMPSDKFKGHSEAGPYGDVVEELDWHVGRLMQTLRAEKLDKNTVVVFASDNGPWLMMALNGGSPGPFAGGKGSTSEGGMRTPAIFWGPGRIKPGRVTDMGATLDLLPTFAELAGAALPKQTLDGVSLVPVLQGKGKSARDTLAYYSKGELFALRKGQYKIVLRESGKSPAEDLAGVSKALDKPKLYDLSRDIFERNNIADSETEVLQTMLKAAEQQQAQLPVAEPLFDQRIQAWRQQ